MRARTLVLFLVAILLAGGTAMLVRTWLANQHAPEAIAAPMPMPQKSILVAREQIPRGQILKPENMTWQQWPEGHISPAYIQSEDKKTDNFSGWVARAPFGPGEPMTQAKMVSPGTRGFLAAALQPGMRALSVPVNKASDVSGFVLPGDQVDILITRAITPAGGAGGTHQIAETVLHDLRVLAVDQKLDSKGDEPIVGQTVTLEATPKESEMIAVAAEMGKLWLSLRSLPSSPMELISASSSGGHSSSDDHHGTFTLDSEVSPLKAFAPEKPTIAAVTILRGNGSNAEVAYDSSVPAIVKPTPASQSNPSSQNSKDTPSSPTQPPPSRTNPPVDSSRNTAMM